jgi:hypothetical protein
MEGRRAEPCVAQRADRAPGKDWLSKVAAVHSITSYPVGPTSEPTFRMHAAKKANEDETHLRNGIGWPLGGTVIIHPVRSAASAAAPTLRIRCYAFKVAPAGTSPVVR